MDALDPALARILRSVVAADGGADRRFEPMFIAGKPAPIAVAPYVEDPQLLLPEPVGELADRGLLAVEPASGPGPFGAFRVTAAGREASARAEAAAAAGRRSAEEQTVDRLTDALGRAARATEDPAAREGLERLVAAAGAVDPEVLAGAVRRAAAEDRPAG